MKTNPHRVFLLGGYDLEMLTIKQMLEGRDGCVVVDKHLQWDNARLSAYQDELSEFADYNIYGIELQEDIPLPLKFHRIDHHNDWAGKPSSIEQVAEVLGVELNRFQQLVAANDKGYIPALKDIGASAKEIDNIRRRDRATQGVTDEDEKEALKELEHADVAYPGLIIVKSSSNNFSPIVDRLSTQYPYHSYLVYSDTSLCVYGDIAPSFRIHFCSHKNLYYGGVGNGYSGLSKLDALPTDIIKIVKKMKPISKHIFLFPFEITKDGDLDEKVWMREFQPQSEADKIALFNEKQYFYPHIHNILYDNGTENSPIKHYKRKLAGGEKYAVTVDTQTFVLDVEAINVNLYDGLGVLSFHLLNTDIRQKDPDSILKINQYGRRVMPPFYAEIKDNHPRAELAEKIEILDNEGKSIFLEDFSHFTYDDTWKAGNFITSILGPLDIAPVIDDRMFVLCYYENSKEMNRIADAKPLSQSFSRSKYNEGDVCKDFWYKYVFVDGGSATCNGDDMYCDLLRKQTYSRWEHPIWGTEYGVSRYSLVALTTETAPHFLLDYFETIYTRMAELVLCQRTAIVLFSKKVRQLSEQSDQYEDSFQLSNQYLHFVNRFWYKDITSQDQGVELYTLLRSTLNIDNHEATLREQIIQLHNKISEKSNNMIEDRSYKLNLMAGLIIPFTIFVSLAGLGQLYKCGFSGQEVMGIALAVIVLGILGIPVLFRLLKLNKK